MGNGEQVPGVAGTRLAVLLRQYMHRHGMKQADLARAAGISPAAVSNAMNPAKGAPSADTLDRLGHALKLTEGQQRELNELRGRADGGSRRLDAYLTAAARAAGGHHYPGVLPGSTPPLAAVYVRQQANPVTADGAGQGGMVHEAPLLETLPADAVLDGSMSCVVLGGPGGGKTSLLRQRMSVGLGRDDRGGLVAVPVLVSAAALIGKPLATAVADAVNADLAPWLLEELPVTFFSSPPVSGARWLLLVDGLDEIADSDARLRVLQALAAVDAGGHGGLFRFVVATRPLPREELNAVGQDTAHYVLEPFRPGDLVKVARAWFTVSGLARPETEAAQFVQALGRTRLAALARLPLMASLLCQIHAADPDQPLPLSRGQIYDSFIRLLHKRQHAPHTPGSPRHMCAGLARYGTNAVTHAERYLDGLPQVIEHLAAERQRGSVLSALVIVESLRESRCPPRVPADEWRAFLAESLRHSGLLTLRAGDHVFLHQTLQEYLAARHAVRTNASALDGLAELLREPGDPAFAHRHRMANDHSYVGFLLDSAYERGSGAAARRFWSRLIEKKTLGAHQNLVALAILGTHLPPSVLREAVDWLMDLAMGVGVAEEVGRSAVRAVAGLHDSYTGDRLHALARDGSLRSAVRAEAAQQLAALGDPRTPDLLHDLARDRRLDGSSRLALAWELEALGDSRTASLLDRMAQDTTLGSASRNAAAQKVAGVGAPHAAGLLHGLALDPALSDSTRLMVTRALMRTGDPRLADLLHDLALDSSLRDPSRLTCARELAGLADVRTIGLLGWLSVDPSLSGASRNLAVRRLADLKAPLAQALWRKLASDDSLSGAARVEAACRLASLADSGVNDLLHHLAQDTSLPGDARVEAAGRMAGLRDPRAVDLLYGLGQENGLACRDRVSAAKRLAMLGAPRAADLLHALASTPQIASGSRADAARQLAILQDRRAASLLATLARDAGLDDVDRWELAGALRKFSDQEGVDVLRYLAVDTALSAGFRQHAVLALTAIDRKRTRQQRAEREDRAAASDKEAAVQPVSQPTAQPGDGRRPRRRRTRSGKPNAAEFRRRH